MKYIGKLLTAPPAYEDDFYEKAVVFVYEFTRGTSFGIAVNKPTDRTVADLCEHYGITYNGREMLYIGGPINPGALIMIHSSDWSCSNTLRVPNTSWRISSDASMLKRIAAGDAPRQWKLCLGMCKWSLGQLQKEVEGLPPYTKKNSWLTGVAHAKLIFHKKPDKIWRLSISTCAEEFVRNTFKIK